MYLRKKTRIKDGKRHDYWALVESYRTERGPRQRTVAWLGELDKAGRLGVANAAKGTHSLQDNLFEKEPEPEWVEVNVRGVRVENTREFGGPWLGLELICKLCLDRFFSEHITKGRERAPWASMAFKEELEKHLKEKAGSLFKLDYDLFLYDVTSTYFEREAAGNPLAKRGYSRDHRGDCKQVCIGLVVTRDGFPLGYEVFAGNRSDVTTVEEIIELSQIKLTDVILPIRNGKEIKLRCVETPTRHQRILLQKLKLDLPQRFTKCNL